jgi:SPP1 gp7 family putative phage head morphogenesis protein
MAAWRVTADPGRFAEAVDWFNRRVVLTRQEARDLGTDAGRRAFFIGGGLQLKQIQAVFDKLGKAVEDGTPFDEWRKSVKSELRNDAHAETVFRNATQRSLNAGRWRQMREPGVLAFRPYWLFDGIDDSRQSPICKKCNGVILPADHAWWHTHTPLLHHRCRSSIRNLRRSEAIRRGITAAPPGDEAGEGFGLSPESEPEWKPDPAKTDPALLRELERKKDKPRPAPKAPKEPPKEHDFGHWAELYAQEYDDTAPAVAWGRTMLERGLDRPAGEVRAELERLRAAGVPGDYVIWLGDLRHYDAKRPLRAQVLNPRQRFAIALSEHTRTIERGNGITLGGPAGNDRRAIAASNFYEQMLDKSVARPTGWKAFATQGARAQASLAEQTIELGSSSTSVAVHELAHLIEDADERALARSLSFLRSRTKGEARKALSELLPDRVFRSNEFARPDKFFNPYIGKDYGDSATEVTATGYQAFAGDDQALAQLLDAQTGDPDMLFFLLGQLAGR